MSGAGAGSGIGGGPPPELPHAEGPELPQQWTDALRGAAALLGDAVATTTVALELNTPAALNMALPRPSVVPDQMAMEGLERRPTGLTAPTPTPDPMAPVNATVSSQDAGPTDLQSPLTPSAALPPQLTALLQVAGYTANASAGTTKPMASPDRAPVGGTPHMPLVSASRAPVASPAPVARSASAPSAQSNAPAQSATRGDAPVVAVPGRTGAPTNSAPTSSAPPATATPSAGAPPHHAGGAWHATLNPSGLLAGAVAGATLAGLASMAGRATLHQHGSPADGERDVVSYRERRLVPIDLAPVMTEAPIWRLDDTQALVTVGPEGPRVAALRAAELYHALLECRAGLAALRRGEGFTTWQGSPLWLALAAIRKPVGLGVLAESAPGRVQVMRTMRGEWLVEHAGGPWRARRAHRHDASAIDDEALLLDVLYGVGGIDPKAPGLKHFDAAGTALRFALRQVGPAASRAQEAWAMVARAGAVAAVQPTVGVLDRALHASVAALLDGQVTPPATDPLRVAPLDRRRFLALTLSGDVSRLGTALHGLGRAALDQLRQCRFDDIGSLDALALAVCLGRLTRAAAAPARIPWQRMTAGGHR